MASLQAVFWNAGERRIRALWRLIVLSIAFVILNVALGLGAAMIVGLIWTIIAGSVPLGITEGGTVNPAALPIEFLASLSVAALVAALVSVWLVGRFIDKRPLADFGLRLNRGWWLDLGFGLALGALLMTGIFLIEQAAGWLTVTGTFQSARPDQSFVAAIAWALALFISVGIYEELLFRGYALRNLAEGLNLPRIGPRGAILIAWISTSAVFGLAHALNPNATAISTLNIGLAGIFLGLAYVLTGSLAIPIGLHITWNFFQGNVFGFPVSGGAFGGITFIDIEQGGPALWTGGAFGPEAGLIGIAAMLVGSALTLLWVRWRHGSIGLNIPIAEPPAALAEPPASEKEHASTAHVPAET
jgi:hypothetical protein